MSAEIPLDAVISSQQPDLSYSELTPILDKQDTLKAAEVRSSKARRYITRGLLGLAAASALSTIATDRVDDAKDAVVEAAPWVGGGILASEAMFIGGAAVMLASVGEKVGNPLKLKDRLPEVVVRAGDSKVFRAGMAINTVGAFGDAAVIAAGTFKEMPVQSWGIAGLAMIDGVGTVIARKWMVDQYHKSQAKLDAQEEMVSPEQKSKLSVRHATIEDIPRLVEIDLERFRKAYGENIPEFEEVRTNFSRRFENAKDWMFVAEVDGIVEGFATAFRTNKSIDEFISWEDSTANGTLDGKVDPSGKYVYVANLTMNPKAMRLDGEDVIFANLFVNAIRDGVEYGYFESRMPLFRAWVNRQVKKDLIPENPSPEQLDQIANDYMNLRKQTRTGESVRFDPQLRMYEKAGFTLERLVPDAFEDEASLNYGVVCKAEVPPGNRVLKKIKPVRHLMSRALLFASKRPKLLKKVL